MRLAVQGHSRENIWSNIISCQESVPGVHRRGHVGDRAWFGPGVALQRQFEIINRNRRQTPDREFARSADQGISLGLGHLGTCRV